MNQELKFTDRGHILAAAGAAVGIANLVLFPARVYNYGGLAFILVFVLCTFILGIPLMIGETALGKNGQSDAVGAYRGIGGKRWGMAGWFGLITCSFILSFYIVVAGWALYYLYLYMFDYQLIISTNAGQLFGTFVTDEQQVIFFSGLFMVATITIVANNIKQGIEWVSKRFVPVLILLIIVLIIILPAIKGNDLNYGNFQFNPHALFTIDQSGRIGIIEAVGQAFFSLSLGACAMITYGSHVHRNTNVVSNAQYIVHTDTVVALLAGLLIIPLFSESGQVSAAPPLVFINLVETFSGFGPFWGRLIGITFFVLFNLAIVTSTISLLEPVVNHLSQKGVGRRTSAIAVGILIFVLSIPAVLSIDSNNATLFTDFLGYGEKSEDGKTSMGYFNFVLDFFGTFCLLAGAFILSVFIKQKWSMEKLFEEVTIEKYAPNQLWKRFLSINILWIIPLTMILLFGAEVIKVLFKIGLIG